MKGCHRLYQLPERQSHPDVIGNSVRIGSPQEMVHTDEKMATRKTSCGEMPVPGEGGSGTKKSPWNGRKRKLSAIKRLIQLLFNCPQHCGALISFRDVPRFKQKCFTKMTYCMGAYVDDLAFNFSISQKATEYGLDGFGTPQCLAMAVELREAGILTEEDFAGTDEYPPCPPAEDKEGSFTGSLTGSHFGGPIGGQMADGTMEGKKIGKGAEV
jgi:hypothetical protein